MTPFCRVRCEFLCEYANNRFLLPHSPISTPGHKGHPNLSVELLSISQFSSGERADFRPSLHFQVKVTSTFKTDQIYTRYTSNHASNDFLLLAGQEEDTNGFVCKASFSISTSFFCEARFSFSTCAASNFGRRSWGRFLFRFRKLWRSIFLASTGMRRRTLLPTAVLRCLILVRDERNGCWMCDGLLERRYANERLACVSAYGK